MRHHTNLCMISGQFCLIRYTIPCYTVLLNATKRKRYRDPPTVVLRVELMVSEVVIIAPAQPSRNSRLPALHCKHRSRNPRIIQTYSNVFNRCLSNSVQPKATRSKTIICLVKLLQQIAICCIFLHGLFSVVYHRSWD